MPTLASEACSACAAEVSAGRSLRYEAPMVNPFGWPHVASAVFAAVRAPVGCVLALYRSNGVYPPMPGGSSVVAIAPPAYGPPHAVCRSVLFAAYSIAWRQARLFSGATLGVMEVNHARLPGTASA